MPVELAPKGREIRSVWVLVFLLFVHLLLISVQVRSPSGAILLKQWALTLGTPLLNLSVAVGTAAEGAWTRYVWLRGAREENLRLRESVRALSLREAEYRELKQQNLRLRSLLEFAESLPLKGRSAQVTGRAPGYLAGTLLIDRGSTSGLRPDLPVVTAEGVVGRTVLVSPIGSQVQLITNTDAAVGVLVQRTGIPGVARGMGSRTMEVSYISNTEQVDVGDLIVTSGLDGIYPRGLPVGRVTESKKGNLVYRHIVAEPAADLMRLSEVLVLLENRWPEAGQQ